MTPRAHALYMLDTNISSGLMKGRLPDVETRLSALPSSQWCISAVTRMEHRYGVELAQHSTRLAKAVDSYLELAPVAPWDAAAADQHGRLRAALKRAGQPIGVYDEMIAAHAMALGAVLVTQDSDFRRVPGLSVEDWRLE